MRYARSFFLAGLVAATVGCAEPDRQAAARAELERFRVASADAAVILAAADGTPTAAEPDWSTLETLARLQRLPALPKPHPTISLPNNAFDTARSAAIVAEIFRITGAGVVRSDFANKSSGRWLPAVCGACKAGGVDRLAVYLMHPADRKPPPPDWSSFAAWPGYYGAELSKLYNDLLVTRTIAAEHGVNVGYVISGTERVVASTGDDDWKRDVTAFNDAVYSACVAACPGAEIVYYSRGNLAPNPAGGMPDGWYLRPLYTLDERGAYLCCDCYWTNDPITTRDQVNRMAKFAAERGRGERVVPWLSWGRGYDWVLPAVGHGNEQKRFTLEMSNPTTQWYIGRWLNYENTAWTDKNGLPLFQRAYADVVAGIYAGTGRTFAADVPFCIGWPGPFDHRVPASYWLDDFEAYVLGASAIVPAESK
jgi:hypothetical protein